MLSFAIKKRLEYEIFMITGSINSNVAQRTSYYGMLRCLGAGKNQVRMLVRLEALFWCKTAVFSTRIFFI
jgi:ABC-type antimicrobial peptide transport system permease subunit